MPRITTPHTGTVQHRLSAYPAAMNNSAAASTEQETETANGAEIRAIAVAGEILDTLAATPDRLSAADLARALGMTPPRAWRHLNSLAAIGLIEGGADRGFTLGGKLASLGQRAAERLDLTALAHPHLEALHGQVRETVYLAVPSEAGATVVVSIDAPNPISLHLALGFTMDWRSSASGRVLLAFAPPGRRDAILADTSTPAGHDPITEPGDLARRLEQIRADFLDTAETAHALPRSQARLLLNAAAAPVFNHTGNAVGAIGILTGIPGREAVTSPEIAGPLFTAARNLSADLGSQRWGNQTPTQAH